MEQIEVGQDFDKYKRDSNGHINISLGFFLYH